MTRAEEIRGAIATETCVRAAGTVLFLDVDGRLMILDERQLTPTLRALCTKYHDSICWLLKARAS